MADWLRSVALLAMAFAAVVVVTIGLSGLIVPGRPAVAGGGPVASATSGVGGGGAHGPAPTFGGIPGLGGTLTASGDYEGAVRLTRESIQETYSLEGDDARMVFGGGRPVSIEQISFDGWEFFPEEGQCVLTPGNLDTAIGIGFAELRCDGLEEIRDRGTVDLTGEIGMPVDLLAESDLPPSGGILTVGDERWRIGESWLLTWEQPTIADERQHNLVLADERRGTSLNFGYDIETHRIFAATVVRDDEEVVLDDTACDVRRTELGRHNPRTAVVELDISCPAVEVPGVGTVPIDGTVVVDELAWPEG